VYTKGMTNPQTPRPSYLERELENERQNNPARMSAAELNRQTDLAIAAFDGMTLEEQADQAEADLLAPPANAVADGRGGWVVGNHGMKEQS
jgi:hypothetical protein